MLDPNALFVQTDIPENLIGKVKVGQTVDLSFGVLGLNSHINGKVASIAPTAVISGADTLFRVLISFPQDDAIRAGMSARVKISPSP